MTTTELATGTDQDASESDTSPSRPRWCLGTRLLVGATGAWLAFLALHAALTGRWWLWLVVEATPPMAFVVIPLALLAVTPLARPVRRPLSLVLMIVLVAGGALAGFYPRTTDTTPTNATALKIFSWNTDIWHMADEPREFYAYLQRQRADVYLLQEYLYWGTGPVRINDLKQLREALPGYHMAVEGELITVSRFPIVATHQRKLPETDNAWYWHGNKAQRTDIRVAGRALSLYNVHLQVPFRVEHSPLTGEFYRFLRKQHADRQAQLSALRTDIARNPNPVLVAGDFNSPWMDSLVRLDSRVRRHDPDSGVLPARSWPVHDYPLPRLWRLDWLFTSSEVKVTEHRLGPSQGLSDHAAQHIRLSLP